MLCVQKVAHNIHSYLYTYIHTKNYAYLIFYMYALFKFVSIAELLINEMLHS